MSLVRNKEAIVNTKAKEIWTITTTVADPAEIKQEEEKKNEVLKHVHLIPIPEEATILVPVLKDPGRFKVVDHLLTQTREQLDKDHKDFPLIKQLVLNCAREVTRNNIVLQQECIRSGRKIPGFLLTWMRYETAMQQRERIYNPQYKLPELYEEVRKVKQKVVEDYNNGIAQDLLPVLVMPKTVKEERK